MGMNMEPRYIKDESVELRCFARGLPVPRVRWFLNDNEIDVNGQRDMFISNDGQSLTIPAVISGRTAGLYSCLATSRAGDARLEQVVVQVEAPEIVSTNLFSLEQTVEEASEKIVEQGSR